MRSVIATAVLMSLLLATGSCRKRVTQLARAPSVIGQIQHRDEVVTVKVGPQGTLYSAQNKDGKILFENLTAEELKVKSPQIYGLITASNIGAADRLTVPLAR